MDTPTSTPHSGAAVIDQPEQIAAFRLTVIRQAAAFKAKTGMSLARNMPTVAALRRQYPALLGQCRTYGAVAETLVEAGY